jgi:hypothetical protein
MQRLANPGAPRNGEKFHHHTIAQRFHVKRLRRAFVIAGIYGNGWGPRTSLPGVSADNGDDAGADGDIADEGGRAGAVDDFAVTDYEVMHEIRPSGECISKSTKSSFPETRRGFDVLFG